jgi:hypothetical protein
MTCIVLPVLSALSGQVETEWAAADKAVAELQKSLDATDEEFKGFEHKDAKVRRLVDVGATCYRCR